MKKLDISFCEICNNAKIAIYGTGKCGIAYHKILSVRRPDIEVICFLDSFIENKKSNNRKNKSYYYNETKIEALLTTHEDLVKEGEDKIFNNILDFYNIPYELFIKKSIPKNMSSHFRKGCTDTWKNDLTHEQQNQVTSMIPNKWKEYFSWL